jgi:5-methylcytosine-specific restriction enzyme subunit McrC
VTLKVFMVKSNIIQVFEYQQLIIDNDKFCDYHFEMLVKYNEKHGNKYFTVGHKKIIFKQFVGVIQVKNLIIEILPKADNKRENDTITKEKWRSALLTMLKECKLIKIESLTSAKLQLRSSSLLDIYFESFLHELEILIRQGLIKKYQTIQNNLKVFKGLMLFQKNITKNLVHKERFFTEHQVYNRNNLLNQILLKALNILLSITNNPALKSKAKNLLIDLPDIEVINVNEKTFKAIKYNRNNERYINAIELARLIILEYSPDIKGGDNNVIAILFDMNPLFEKFIFRQLKKAESNYENLTVQEQVREKFWGTKGIKPDILIKHKDKFFIIDTKWKVITELQPSDDDLKQMYDYNHHYDSDFSILLYPKVHLDSTKKQSYHLKRIGSDKFEKEHFCQLGFIELFEETNEKFALKKKNIGLEIINQFIV